MSATRDLRFYALRKAFLKNVDDALVQVRADRSLLDARSGLGETLLHWFAVEKREDLVTALLRLGAAVDPVNHFGSTPFAEATELENRGMCRLLIEHGAMIDPVNSLGETPLMTAAFRGRESMCRLLLDWGASAAFINSDGESVLASAVRGGKMETVQAILEHLDPKIDINTLIGDADRYMLEQTASGLVKLLQKRGLNLIP